MPLKETTLKLSETWDVTKMRDILENRVDKVDTTNETEIRANYEKIMTKFTELEGISQEIEN